MINTIVSTSNLYALYFIKQQPYIIIPMIASILMHLSERKHNLPGIYPFNLYSTQFLWLDRIIAVSSGLYIIRNIYLSNFTLLFNNNFLLLNIIGFISMFISETSDNRVHDYQLVYMIFHIIWHICAFHILGNY